jgi:N-acetylglucosaminyldiphosphoundecaprenol N-acetyl-beta-D-mannosaminyltransferase
MKSVSLLGVRIDDASFSEVVSKIYSSISSNKKIFISTPNPEFLMYAQSNPEFKSILNQADLNIPDGNGLKLSGKIGNNIPGVDLMDYLIKESIEKGFTIGLLGGSKGLAEKLSDCLKVKYPKIRIKFASSDIVIDSQGLQIKPDQSIAIPELDLLFVALGHPKQEKWIYQNLNKLPVKVAIGVGGSFDYLAGTVKRAPLFLRKLGLEWLYRLITQPWRLKRQLVLIKFIYLILKERLIG